MITKMKAARTKLGLTQGELAFRSRVTNTDISKLENGRILPYPAVAARLAQVLGLSPDELQHPADDAGDAPPEPRAPQTPQAIIEAALLRELKFGGLSRPQCAAVFRQLHERLASVPPELRAAATFVRYVEMVDAIVMINGPGVNYPVWRKGVQAVLAAWKTKAVPPEDGQMLRWLAAREQGSGAGAESVA